MVDCARRRLTATKVAAAHEAVNKAEMVRETVVTLPGIEAADVARGRLIIRG